MNSMFSHRDPDSKIWTIQWNSKFTMCIYFARTQWAVSILIIAVMIFIALCNVHARSSKWKGFYYVQKQLPWYFNCFWWVPWSDHQKANSHRPVMLVDFVFSMCKILMLSRGIMWYVFSNLKHIFKIWKKQFCSPSMIQWLILRQQSTQAKEVFTRYKWLFGFI